MHTSGQNKLLLDAELSSDACLERFDATVADAYCFYLAHGRDKGAGALRSMASLDSSVNFESRIVWEQKQIASKIGKNFKQFERASLEAYLLSPFANSSSRPKLVRLSQAKNPKQPRAESPSSSVNCAVQPQSTAEAGPAIKPPVVAAPVAEPMPHKPAALETATPLDEAIAEPAPAVHEANEKPLADLNEVSKIRVLKDGTRVRVRKESGQGNRGLHGDGIPCAVIVGYDGCGVYGATSHCGRECAEESRAKGAWKLASAARRREDGGRR